MALTKPEHKHTVAPEIVEAKKKKPTTHQLIHKVIDYAQEAVLVIGQDATRILDPVTMESLVTVVPVSIQGAQDIDVKEAVQSRGGPAQQQVGLTSDLLPARL